MAKDEEAQKIPAVWPVSFLIPKSIEAGSYFHDGEVSKPCCAVGYFVLEQVSATDSTALFGAQINAPHDPPIMDEATNSPLSQMRDAYQFCLLAMVESEPSKEYEDCILRYSFAYIVEKQVSSICIESINDGLTGSDRVLIYQTALAFCGYTEGNTDQAVKLAKRANKIKRMSVEKRQLVIDKMMEERKNCSGECDAD